MGDYIQVSRPFINSNDYTNILSVNTLAVTSAGLPQYGVVIVLSFTKHVNAMSPISYTRMRLAAGFKTPPRHISLTNPRAGECKPKPSCWPRWEDIIKWISGNKSGSGGQARI